MIFYALLLISSFSLSLPTMNEVKRHPDAHRVSPQDFDLTRRMTEIEARSKQSMLDKQKLIQTPSSIDQEIHRSWFYKYTHNASGLAPEGWFRKTLWSITDNGVSPVLAPRPSMYKLLTVLLMIPAATVSWCLFQKPEYVHYIAFTSFIPATGLLVGMSHARAKANYL